MLEKVHKKKIWAPPRAEDYNAMAMAAEAYLAGPDRTPERQQPVNPCVAWVKNSSGGTRSQYDCLELSVTLQLAKVTRENTWIDGVAPTGTELPFAISLWPLGTSKWGPGQVAGICPARVNVNDVTHRFAYVKKATYILESCDGYYADVSIVQNPNATGTQTCVVLFQRRREMRGMCLAENHPGRGVDFDVNPGDWSLDDDEWIYDTGTTLTAIDWRFGVPYPDAGATGLFMPRLSAAHGLIWEVVALDCDSPGACGA